MPLVKMTELFAARDDNSFAIGAFNVSNMEMAMGAIQAAEELQTPLILQIAEGRLKYSPLELLGPIILKIDRRIVNIKMTHDKGMTDESLRSDLSSNNKIILFPLLVNQK